MSARRVIMLVARREIHERMRGKAFLISTVVMLVFVGGSAGLQGALSKKPTYRFAVTAPAPSGLAAALQRAAEPFDDANVHLRVVRSPAAGRQALEDEKVDALLLLPRDRLLFRSSVDAKAAAVADTAVRAVRNHEPPRPELTAATLHRAEQTPSDAETLVAIAGSVLLLTSLAVYGQWVLGGVVEERHNRVVELILATTRPRHLLAGKVIGIGLLGFAQLTLVAGLAALMLAAGVFDAPASLGGSLALVIPWFVLGFAALRGRLRRRRRARLPAAERRDGGTARHLHDRRRVLRRLPRARKRHGRAAGEHPHDPSADRAARAARPQCTRRCSALAARCRGGARARLDLRDRSLRRPRLRPRAASRWAPPRGPRRLAPHPHVAAAGPASSYS